MPLNPTPVNPTPVNEELRQFVTDNFLFGKNSRSIGDEDSFLEKGIIDSTGVLELVAFLESRFGIQIEDRELVPANLDSINNLVRFLSAKQSSN